MSESVTLVGFDIGSTTLRAGFAEAKIVRNAGARGSEFGQLEERAHSEPTLTPFVGNDLDGKKIIAWIDHCFEAAHIAPSDLFGGGGLLTGLAARAPNAQVVAQALRSRLANAVITTADDPKLEAWLAFQGSVGALSRAHPHRIIVNLDIGGGTTNIALGRAGQVLWTGYSWIGARHVVVFPGNYQIERLSEFGRKTLDSLGISKHAGDELTSTEVETIVTTWVRQIEALVDDPEMLSLGQCSRADVHVAFSGGVGELFYSLRERRRMPERSPWGDLGLELAQAMAKSPALNQRVVISESMGKATLYGLLEHQTQISGATVFLPRPDILPLGDLPIVGIFDANAPQDELFRIVAFARASRAGACAIVRNVPRGAAEIRALGQRIGAALHEHPVDRPLVLLVDKNAGKALGGYATDWGNSPRPIVVLDELTPAAAQFIHVGRAMGGMVSVSFHGFR